LELEREGPSYTVDTMRALQEAQPEADFFFLVGIDAVRELPRWRRPDELLTRCRLAALRRAGAPPLDQAALAAAVPASAGRILEVAVPEIEISSTDLRRRLREGRSVRYRLPEAVTAYINERK